MAEIIEWDRFQKTRNAIEEEFHFELLVIDSFHAFIQLKVSQFKFDMFQ